MLARGWLQQKLHPRHHWGSLLVAAGRCIRSRKQAMHTAVGICLSLQGGDRDQVTAGLTLCKRVLNMQGGATLQCVCLLPAQALRAMPRCNSPAQAALRAEGVMDCRYLVRVQTAALPAESVQEGEWSDCQPQSLSDAHTDLAIPPWCEAAEHQMTIWSRQAGTASCHR